LFPVRPGTTPQRDKLCPRLRPDSVLHDIRSAVRLKVEAREGHDERQWLLRVPSLPRFRRRLWYAHPAVTQEAIDVHRPLGPAIGPVDVIPTRCEFAVNYRSTPRDESGGRTMAGGRPLRMDWQDGPPGPGPPYPPQPA